MNVEILAGDVAAGRLAEACALVKSTVPYLRAETGVRGPWAPAGAVPDDGMWIRCGDLVCQPDWLETIIRATGRRLGSDDPVVAASLFVQNYSYRVLTLAIACATTSGVVPDCAAASMAMVPAGGRPVASHIRCKSVTDASSW